MNEDHDFPPEWGWKRYEPAMREWIAQCARIIEVKKQGPIVDAQAQQLLSVHWRDIQEEKGRIPPTEEREKRGDEYIKCLDRLLKKAQADLRAGRLRNGQKHLSRRHLKLTSSPEGGFDLIGWNNARSKDSDSTLKTRIKNKLANVREDLEVKRQEQRRQRRRR